MQILRKSALYRHFKVKSDKKHYFENKYQGNDHFTHTLQTNQMKTIAMNANTKEFDTLYQWYGQIRQTCYFKCKYKKRVT